jgi:hypothetical protein
MMEFGLDEMDPDSQPRYGSRAAQAVSAGNTHQDGRTQNRSGVDLMGFIGRLRPFGRDGSSLP